ncbi:MAG: hypothetical protein LQ340_007538 [Diploschistes diacapsis]|nr:MAG: hypothetical protein LQ340_007538 [Diploschistes diacapsis]
MLTFPDIISPQPSCPLKRSASHLSDIQPVSLSPFIPNRSTSPTTARLFDFILSQPICLDRKFSRSDSFLLQLEKGNSEIEERSRRLDAIPGLDSESEPSEEKEATLVNTMPPTTTSEGKKKAASTKSNVSNSTAYRETELEDHGIMIEAYRREPSACLTDFLKQHVKGSRSVSVELNDKTYEKCVLGIAAKFAVDTETIIRQKFMSSPMFPDDAYLDDCFASSGETKWSEEPLPVAVGNEKTKLHLPSPDCFYGFSINGAFTQPGHRAVFAQEDLKPYFRPTTKRVGFPFLVWEAKALSRKGTAFDAQNQAAVVATHAVRGMQKLYEEANQHRQPHEQFPVDCTDTLVFAMSGDTEQTFLYVCFWDEDRRFHFQKVVDGYRTTNLGEVNSFRLHWSNVFDWAQKVRLPKVQELLDVIAKRRKLS